MDAKYYFLILTVCFAFSCSLQTREAKEALNEAESIIEQQPDSAFRLLNTIFFPEELSEKQYNRYMLLMMQAKDKSYRNIKSDTLIFDVRDYYIVKKDFPKSAMATYYCGRVLHEQDNGEKAIEAYLQALGFADKTSDDNMKGLIHGNLAILYNEHSFYPKAIEESRQAVEIFKKVNNHKNEISSLNIIGDCFLLEEQTDSAFYYYNESLKLADHYQIPDLQSNVRQSMGVAYRQTGNYGQAKSFFAEALSFSADSVEQVRILLNISKMYMLESKIDSAKSYHNQAKDFQIHNPFLIRSSTCLLSEMNEKNGQYQEALKYYKEFYDYTLKVFKSEKNNKLLEIREKYDFEKLKNEKTQLAIQHQKTVQSFTLVSFLVCIIIIIIYRRLRRKKRQILGEAKQEIVVLQKKTDDLSSEKQAIRDVLLQYLEVIKKIIFLENTMPDREKKDENEVIKKTNQTIFGKDELDWDNLYFVINNLNDGFYDKVRNQYPALKEKEFQIVCLSCEPKFNDAEIAMILGTTVFSVQRVRSDLRKKIEIPIRGKIRDFLSKKILSEN
jgi:tetratricopeptide (TPR) repeat protein